VPRTTAEPRDDAAVRLRAGASALGVQLDDAQVATLCRFLHELELWNARVNLVGERDRLALVERHLVDSLAAVPLLSALEAAPRIADVGSGAGLPGVPLAIALRAPTTWLIEPRKKRASFLRSVRRALGDVGLEVVEARGEDVAARADCRGAFDVVVSRATLADRDLLACAAPLVRPGGLLVAYRGPNPGSPPDVGAVHASSFDGPTVHRYDLKGAGRAFRLDVWTRCFT